MENNLFSLDESVKLGLDFILNDVLYTQLNYQLLSLPKLLKDLNGIAFTIFSLCYKGPYIEDPDWSR